MHLKRSPATPCGIKRNLNATYAMVAFCAAVACAGIERASAQWVSFTNETGSRLVAPANLPDTSSDEADFAWGDLDKDGDIDLVAVYKQIGTSTGRRPNFLFMNESGVLTDRSVEFASASDVATSQGFLDLTNDRDVTLVDVNGDTWLDVVTATTLSGGSGGTAGTKWISHPRIYINLGETFPGSGVWAGLNFDDENRVPTMPAEPRFCAVSAGDIDNDGDQDLYFGDYQQGFPTRPVDLNDRLWINDGTGTFTDETATRMTAEMAESSFGMSTAIEDMNNDGRLDIIKDDALNAPQGISISYNNPNGIPGQDGFFTAYEIAYANTPYHVAVGDLNNDGLLDLVVSDDALDYYTLNSGNGGDNLANFAPRQTLLGADGGFNSNNIIADLNNDTWNDAIVLSVDVDAPACNRTDRLYENLGNAPGVTLQQTATATAMGFVSSHLMGGHDVAVFDIDGDNDLDLVLGTCSGTWVYINNLNIPGGCDGDAACDLDGLFCTFDRCINNACQIDPSPCLVGEFCDEANDTCVECLNDGHCDTDGLFCTNDVCVNGTCQVGPDLCPGQLCDEGNQSCVDCLTDNDCDADGLFCTNDQCVGGSCQVGPDPCPGLFCDDFLNQCTGCLIDAHCDADGLFCTNDQCVAGSCQVGPDICPGQTCDEANDVCFTVECATDDDCDDGLNCTIDLCVASLCVVGPAPCSGGLMCDEVRGCVECSLDSDCGGGQFCCDNQCQAVACPVALQAKAGDPIQGLTQAQLDRFFVGKAEFNRNITVEEGLGPAFNRSSCGTCHNNPVGGSGGLTVTRFGIVGPGGSFDPLASMGGSLLQALAVEPSCQEIVPTIVGELVHTATRSTPSTLGFGLIEAVPDSEIESKALNSPATMVTGRVHMVQPLEGGPVRVGRFGWKAQVATVLTFSGDAALNEMGLTNDLVPTENAPNGDAALLAACDTVPDPEDVPDAFGVRFIDRVTDFQRFLAAPPQTPKAGMTGETIFAQIGCTDCHTAVFYTPDSAGLESALRDKPFRPYADFLLHDMGPLGDDIVQGAAQGKEIRTPPLWGVRRRDPMLHDASVQSGTFATRVHQAILVHGQSGSEAEESVVKYLALQQSERDAIVAFLDSLGRCEFDLTGDDQVNHDDYFEFLACFTGPGTFYTADDPCSVADIDQDGDVDDDDFFHFRIATEDCCDLDGNGIRDDGCTYCDPSGACTYTSLSTFADMSGTFGACPPDTFANIFDANQALACFAEATSCPRINIDAGGAFNDCNPDGFCNVFDANHALAGFASLSACTCPPSPSPQMPPVIVENVALAVQAAKRAVRPGGLVQVHVFLENGTEATRSYQLHVEATGGRNGQLELVDVSIEDRDDYLFATRPDALTAFNAKNGQMLATIVVDEGVKVGDRAYLATYTYRASDDAVGAFVIDVRYSENIEDQTFFVASGNRKIAVDGMTPAVVTVTNEKAVSLR